MPRAETGCVEQQASVVTGGVPVRRHSHFGPLPQCGRRLGLGLGRGTLLIAGYRSGALHRDMAYPGQWTKALVRPLCGGRLLLGKHPSVLGTRKRADHLVPVTHALV